MKASTPTVTLARADTQVAPYAQVRGIPVGADALIGPLPRLPSTTGQRQRKEKQFNATTTPIRSAPSGTGRKY